MNDADYQFNRSVLQVRERHGAAVFCPIEDEPLPEELEKVMDTMGPHGYLAWLCERNGNRPPDLSPLTPTQARRTARRAVRLGHDPRRFMN